MSAKVKKKKDTKSILANLDPNLCVFCKRNEDNEDSMGKVIRKCNMTVHYFCMLFSSGLGQRGKSEEQGILGFLVQDILKEVKRGTRLRCTYCRQSGATIGCVVSSCRKVFHFNCGRSNGTLHQYYDSYRSFCEEHRPRQNNPVSDRLAFYGTANTLCAICMSSVETRSSNETLRAPCCRNSWFHRSCIQRHSTAAGLYFFKCPLCNNKDMFQAEMLQFGIYLPDQDAAWEREPNAFNELLERYTHCDAMLCKCPHGREYNKDGGKWEIITCDWCGSKGTHVGCHSLHKIGSHDVCADCKIIDEKTRKEKGLPKQKKPSRATRFLSPHKSDTKDLGIDESKGKSEYPGQTDALKKATPPLQKKYSTQRNSVSPGTVLHLSYDETDGDVVVDEDDSEDDISLSEFARKRREENFCKKRKCTFKQEEGQKRLRRTRSSQMIEFSQDEDDNYDTESQSDIVVPARRITAPRKISSTATSTVTRESENDTTATENDSCFESNSKEASKVKVKRKPPGKDRIQVLKRRKRDPFCFIPSQKSKKRAEALHRRIANLENKKKDILRIEHGLEDSDLNYSSATSRDYLTDDSQFGDSESVMCSETENEITFSPRTANDGVMSTHLKNKSYEIYPAESTPKTVKLTQCDSPRSSPRLSKPSLTLNEVSPVRQLYSSRESSVVKNDKSQVVTTEFGRNTITATHKLTLDQAGKEKKSKVRGKYNKLKNDANQMSIKMWLQGSSSKSSEESFGLGSEKKDNHSISKLENSHSVSKKETSKNSPQEQRKSLVIKFKGKRFIMRRTIKNNKTIKNTVEVDGKTPRSPLKVKPLPQKKNIPKLSLKSTGGMLKGKPKSNEEEGKDGRMRSNANQSQSLDLESTKNKITDHWRLDGCQEKNKSALSQSPTAKNGYPTRKAAMDQKNLSLVSFTGDLLYTSPKRNKCTMNSKFDDVYMGSPSREIDVKSESDSSTSGTITENLSPDNKNQLIVLDANENICNGPGISKRNGKTDSDDEVIIIQDSKGGNSVEMSPVGDTYQCVIVDIGGKEVLNKDLQDAQYLNLSIKQGSFHDVSANDSDFSGTDKSSVTCTIQNISSSSLMSATSSYTDQEADTSSCVVQSFDTSGGFQQLLISVPNNTFA